MEGWYVPSSPPLRPPIDAVTCSALDAGAFVDEITPISIPSKKGVDVFSQDEHPRPQATVESLAKLPSVFAKGGVVSAGNASGICDGAAANVIVSEEAVKRYGLKPLARLVSYHVVAVEPTIMGECTVDGSGNRRD